MSDIVERLFAPSYWISGSDEGHEGDNNAPIEAAKTIESLRAELAKVNMEVDRLTRTNQAKREHRDKLLEAGVKAAARIQQLEAEVKVWQGHTKTAVWSDSEECKVLSSEVERLLKSRNRWAKKYNDLLAKRRAEDGYDVYAAAREEYRKKIAEQAARIEQLEAALRDVHAAAGNNHLIANIARAALEEKA